LAEFEGSNIVPTDVQWANVEALGEPGQRRFRLIISANGETTIVWMEKQQLDALGQAFGQILMQLPKENVDSSEQGAPPSFDLSSHNQFRVGRIEIGYDEQRDRIVVVAFDVETVEESNPSLVCRFSRSQASELSEEASRVVAAGRPRCVLCGAPMGPGPHACADQNGHLTEDSLIPET
jgi:uncharacterized repeat protein (TIGR03847 family)